MSQTACSFYLQAKVFVQVWLNKDLFPHRGLYFSTSHTDSPIVGASDMSQVSTVDLGQDLVPFKYFYWLKNWVLPFCHKGEVHNHWIFVSEKQINKSHIPTEYVCQKQNTQKRCLSQKPSLWNKFHRQLRQLQKEFSLTTVPVCGESPWESIIM